MNIVTKLIMGLIVIGIIVIICLFGIVLGKEIVDKEEISQEVEENIQLNNTEEKLEEEPEEPEEQEQKENEEKVDFDFEEEIKKPKDEEKQETEIVNLSKYTGININEYFYNQLDTNSKEIYKGLISNTEKMKSGTYNIEYGNIFLSVLEKENGQTEMGKCFQSAVEAYKYDNPELFYIDPNKMNLIVEKTVKGKLVTYNVYITSKESTYLINGLSNEKEVNAAINELNTEIKKIISNKTNDDYDNVKLAHDYLVDNLEYDQTIARQNTYNIYGALIEKKCVCEGYAEAMQYILECMGIESVYVTGIGVDSDGNSENHAWNYVELDSKWYAIDVTWDDPIIKGGGTSNDTLRYKNFLKGETTISKNHTENRKTNGSIIFKYPQLSVKDYH